MSEAAPSGDPSMEDILASIRRILDEDQPARPDQPDQPAATADPPGPVLAHPPEARGELVLDASMLVTPARRAGGELPHEHPQPPGGSAMPSDQPEPPATAGQPMPYPGHGLIGSAAADETASSMTDLMRAVAGERGTTLYREGPTLEQVVRTELRPLLKDWLDRHLPPLVERLVRAEIERVSGRAGAD